NVGKGELNGSRNRLTIEAQQLVGAAVGTRGMRRNAKAHGGGIKGLLLLVNAASRPPPPRLMDKRSVRRIHQSDHAVIHIAWEFRRQLRDLVFPAGEWKLRNRRRIQNGTARFRHEDPHVSIALLAWIMRSVNLLRAYPRIGSKRRDLHAGAGMHVELPSVIAALEVLSFDSAAGERNAAMRTDVLHRERMAIRIAS